MASYWLNSGAFLVHIPYVLKGFYSLVDHIVNGGGACFVLMLLPDSGTGFIKGRQL